MKSVALSNMLAMALFCGGSAFLSGCGSGSEPRDAGFATGTLSVPLLTKTNDHVYRLSNALIYLFGARGTVLLTGSDDPNETVLSQSLETGRYEPFLYSWTLERQASSGAFHPVSATLIASPTSFEIFNGTTTSISYQFQTDGSIIRIGSGSVQVAVSVTETSPICTPLGEGCGVDGWCPPTELTGSVPACYAAGTIEIGQPCDGPTSCVANASCFDFGTAPLCAALCSESQFGQACSTGGVCESLGQSYGVCR